jgi:adenosine deaminase/aminodeoxyfutalosine deaminase
MARSELHLHLEGSIDPATVHRLDPSLSIAEIEEHFEFQGFGPFLNCFKWIAQRLKTPEDYGTVTRRLLERLEQEDILYAELTLAAGVVLWKKQDLDAIFQAVRREVQASRVEVYWNLDAIRQFGPEPAMEVARFAARHIDEGVVSLGIGGDEAGGPAHWFESVYGLAKEKGLRLTAHAGETAGPESIWAALAIGAERIGHGIRAIEDPVLLKHLRDRQIPLEVCITSNVITGAAASLAEHPVRRLYDSGVPITLNTDDPGIFRTTLAREFALARDHFGFGEADLATIAKNAWDFRFAGSGPLRSAPHPEA